ncbi:DUF1566 domain-containing protein [Vibrio hepatarius]|uniref:DUF1566 domain-containing protein n=1 Tax=Vibrio hepatarius TaxID=171383 RepID=UPI001C09E47F|nr:DUF1566 domain-containing protein [Vibrio hepatarius]MBU2898972.1 DUF1566 domain-containing protein [Vibrio hepatarius]
MNKVKYTIQLTTLAATILLLVGCGSGGAFEGDNVSSNNSNTGGSNQVTVNPEARVYELTIETGNREIYSSLQYQVSGKYDDGSEQDITSLVKFEVTNNIVSFDDEGVALPNMLGTTQVTATLNGVTSDPVTLDVIETLVCGHTTGNTLNKNLGGGIDDDSKSTASGECLKIREILDPSNNKYKWFTSTPSLQLMNKLGYITTPEDDTPNNSGDSYAQAKTEDGNDGPAGFSFAAFRQDGLNAIPPTTVGPMDHDAGKFGQAYRWCEKLNEIEFAGKTGWQIPSWNELMYMTDFEASVGSMYDRFGWPVGLPYQAWQSWNGKFDNFRLLEPREANNLTDATADQARYVSCVVDL